MDFTLEQTEFPTAVHRQIYFAARGLTPLESSLEGLDDPALRASCGAYHAFTLRMLSDMYDHPEAWGLPAGELEDYLAGEKLNRVKRRAPAATARVLAHLRNAVTGYTLLLCLLGQAGTPREGALPVSAEALGAIRKRVCTAVSPIPLEKRLGALARVGLTERGGVFTADEPEMLPALCALARSAGEKQSGFGRFAFDRLEYRVLAGAYRPTPEDYFRPLIQTRRETARALHELALRHGCRAAVSTFWKTDYKYKSAQVMCVDSTEGELDVRITETYRWDDPALINDRLAAQPPEMQRYALRRLWRCTGCAADHLGGFATVLGKRQRVCGGGVIGFRWRNPSDADVAALEELLRLRCEILDELKGRKPK